MALRILDLTLSDLGSSQPEKVGGPVLARIVRAIVARVEAEPGEDPTLRAIVHLAAKLGHGDAMAVSLGDRVGETSKEVKRRRRVARA